MRFLGLRVEDHDSNITYTDGTKVKYLSTERYYGIKHHGYNNTWQWEDILNHWDLSIDDVDAIAVISDQVEFDKGELYREIDLGLPCRCFAIDHHWAHVLSQWPVGIPYTNYVFDGYGSNERSHSLFVGTDLGVEYNVNKHGSIGIEMAKVGAVLGLKDVTPDGLDLAGKVMGLAAYGLCDEEYFNKMSVYPLSRIKDIWNYDSWDRKWDNDFDINWLRTVHELTSWKLADLLMGEKDNVYSTEKVGFTGGVAQNCVFVGNAIRHGAKLTTIPHANDCGLSLGAVEFLRQHFHEEEFDSSGFPFWQDDEGTEEVSDDTIVTMAEEIAAGNIVGWYQGHGELGPRALGNRSILCNPRIKNMKDTLNSRVKHREHFRPFGASVLDEDVREHFVGVSQPIPWMNASFQCKDESLSAVTHVDGSCRIQTVSGDGQYARLLRAYKELTGSSVILNTSLNLGGKPICSKHWEAKELFSKTNMDFLAIGNDVLHK